MTYIAMLSGAIGIQYFVRRYTSTAYDIIIYTLKIILIPNWYCYIIFVNTQSRCVSICGHRMV